MANERLDFVTRMCNKFKLERLITRQNPPLYQQLANSRYEIRLLQVQHRPSNSPLSFRFQNVALHYQPLYFALSYIWGNPTITENVTVNDHTLAVTKNLATALRYIGENLDRLFPGVSFIWLWVDAICINQSDVVEKNFQVGLMRNIYNQAQLVISWLGLDGDGKPFAIDRIEMMASRIRDAENSGSGEEYSWLENHQEYCDKNSFRVFESDLRRVLDHDYWGRVWILQEVALAHHVVLMSGSEIIASIDLVVALSWLYKIQRTQPARPPKVDSTAWHYLTDPLHFSFVDLRMHFRLGDFQSMPNLGVNFLPSTVRLQATDPRDKVYGIQGIAPMGVVVDYTKETKDVYIDVAKKWIESDLVLPLLCRAGIGLQPHWENPFGLPSWVPDWHTLSHGKAGNQYHNAMFDSRAATPNDAVWFPHSFPQITAGNHLLLGGAIFDTIVLSEWDFGGPHGDMNDVISFCAIFAQLDNDPGCKIYPTKIPRLQAIFRLVQAGIFSHNDTSRLYELCLGFLYALAHLDLPFPTNMAELPKWNDDRVARLSSVTGLRTDERFSESLQEFVLGAALPCPDEWRGRPAIEVLNDRGRFRNLHWSVMRNCFRLVMCRRIFHTSTGYLGIGPPGICDGDIVVTLSSVPWPAVLRKKGSCYQLVGLCCVVDIMSSDFWDAWKQAKDCSSTIEVFELC
ncbi:HET-domain-containing protein [Acephala macrosclerotiorum]|nr:HET-domain-containing protein [Acephala macrosclerotiorum]